MERNSLVCHYRQTGLSVDSYILPRRRPVPHSSTVVCHMIHNRVKTVGAKDCPTSSAVASVRTGRSSLSRRSPVSPTNPETFRSNGFGLANFAFFLSHNRRITVMRKISHAIISNGGLAWSTAADHIALLHLVVDWVAPTFGLGTIRFSEGMVKGGWKHCCQRAQLFDPIVVLNRSPTIIITMKFFPVRKAFAYFPLPWRQRCLLYRSRKP